LRLVLFGFTAWLTICGYAQAPSALKLDRLQAFLFNTKTGEFSADILHAPRPELGNVPVGPLASNATFVSVKVFVGDAPRPKTLRIRLTATEAGTAKFAEKQAAQKSRVLLDRSAPLGTVNAEGFTYAGFWISDTGCREIHLKAQITGGTPIPPISDVLPFTCYE